jgi:hypothetical protein
MSDKKALITMEIKTKDVLKRIGDLEREIEYIRRDLMHLEKKSKQKPSLFGSVRDGDVTYEICQGR